MGSDICSAEPNMPAFPGAWLAADGMQAAWLRVGQGFCPENFPLGSYKSAGETATFLLRCHIQGPTQDLLLADFDSLSRGLGLSCPNLGLWQSLVFDAFHSATLSFYDLSSAPQTTLFHVKGFTNDCFTPTVV